VGRPAARWAFDNHAREHRRDSLLFFGGLGVGVGGLIVLLTLTRDRRRVRHQADYRFVKPVA
jgi:hypothetical protein